MMKEKHNPALALSEDMSSMHRRLRSTSVLSRLMRETADQGRLKSIGRCGRRWGLAEAALGVAGKAQETLWALQAPLWAQLGSRKGRSGRRWSFAGRQGPLCAPLALARSGLGLVEASTVPLLRSLGPRRGRSGSRWGLAGNALGVA